jgi:hypothetical protein
MHIITYGIQINSLKKLSNRIQIKLIKKFNRTNQTRPKTKSNIKQITNYNFFLKVLLHILSLPTVLHERC